MGSYCVSSSIHFYYSFKKRQKSFTSKRIKYMENILFVFIGDWKLKGKKVLFPFSLSKTNVFFYIILLTLNGSSSKFAIFFSFVSCFQNSKFIILFLFFFLSLFLRCLSFGSNYIQHHHYYAQNNTCMVYAVCVNCI